MSLEFEFKAYDSKAKRHSVVICLAGRGGDGGNLAREHYNGSGLSKTSFIGVTPWNLCQGRHGKYYSIEWYPQPYSATDQDEAVRGLETARRQVERIIVRAMEVYDVPRERVALLGFSAGAVMSVYSALHGDRLGGVVAHAGAILEPKAVPNNAKDTPLLIVHGTNDNCFDWFERYVPMKNALVQKKYDVSTFEHGSGHWVRPPDVAAAGKFLSSRLGYEEDEFDDAVYTWAKRTGKSVIRKGRVEQIPKDWSPGETHFFV